MRHNNLARTTSGDHQQVADECACPSIEQIAIRRIPPPKCVLAQGGAFSLRQAFHSAISLDSLVFTTPQYSPATQRVSSRDHDQKGPPAWRYDRMSPRTYAGAEDSQT
jgi:hypothetical protein